MLPSSRATRDPRFQRGGVGDINRSTGRLHAPRLQLGNGAGDLIRVARADRDPGAFAGQRIRNRPPDAARAAEHDGVSSLQTQIHFVVFLCCYRRIVAAKPTREKAEIADGPPFSDDFPPTFVGEGGIGGHRPPYLEKGRGNATSGDQRRENATSYSLVIARPDRAPSIPETPMIEPIRRSVLDRRVKPGGDSRELFERRSPQ